MKKTYKLIDFCKKVDNKIMGGKLYRIYQKSTLPEKKYNTLSLLRRRIRKKSKISKISILGKSELAVKDILLAQYYNGDFSKYEHFDGAVRLMAIRNYYGEDNEGFNLYIKMQKNEFWRQRFIDLILSYSKGYNEKMFIELDNHLAIMDGSHRVMLAYYNNQEFIKVKILDTLRLRGFDLDFFWKNGFSYSECKLIEKCTEDILNECNYDFWGVIWPPAYDLADAILNDINHYAPNMVRAEFIREEILDKRDFEGLFLAIYHPDILDERGAKEKLKFINNSMPIGFTNYRIKIFKIHIENPKMTINLKNISAQSSAVKDIKTTFRKRYEGKIKNYKYDVIVHITDNYLQSKFCSLLFDISRNITPFFEQIKSKKYVVIRAKESNQHKNFPKRFYLGSNSNIIVNINDFEQVVNTAYIYAIEYFAKADWVHVYKSKSLDGCDVVVTIRDYTLFKFEFSSSIFGFNPPFIDECYEHRISDGQYYYLPETDEVLIRLIEYIRKPQKKFCYDYLVNHLSCLDERRLFLHLNRRVVSEKKVRRAIAKLKSRD